MFDNQIEVIQRRWPQLASRIQSAPLPTAIEPLDHGSPTVIFEGIQVTSAHNRHDEALLQASLIPGNAKRATVYGLGLGDLPRVLLGREEIEHLTVVLFNASLARVALECFDLSDWLEDVRLELRWGSTSQELESPFAVSPSSLRLACEETAPLRDRVQLELTTPFLRRHANQRSEVLEKQIRTNQARFTTDPDVAQLFDAQLGRTIHVAAAGPSLDSSFEQLASRPPEEPLYAVDAALYSLLEAGIVPDIVLAIDPSRKGILPYFRGNLSSCVDSTLVYGPAVHPDVLACWPGRRHGAYTTEACYTPWIQRIPRAALYVSGTVTHCAVDLAVRAGAVEVVLHGADFSFPRGLSHVKGAAHSKRMDVWAKRGVWVENRLGERVPTLPNLRGYLRDLERYIVAHPQVRFVQTSVEGARINGAAWQADATKA